MTSACAIPKYRQHAKRESQDLVQAKATQVRKRQAAESIREANADLQALKAELRERDQQLDAAAAGIEPPSSLR